MPIIEPGAKVLVTGANGFAAMWAVQRLLDRGYSVRGTVRSSSKGCYVKEYFHSYGDRFELAIVPDITEDAAFNEILVGVTGVLHMASPVPNHDLKDPKDYIEPALRSTTEILKSALKISEMKRIVITSSIASIINYNSEQPTTYTEKDWNEVSVKLTEELGTEATSGTKYCASKVIAEKAAWEFYAQHKQTSPYDLVVIHPPGIFGPAIHELGKEPSSLGISAGAWYNVVANPDVPKSDKTLAEVITWVDVRDLADAHISALEKEEASGERIIVAAGKAAWQEWINVANQVPSPNLPRPLSVGKPGIPPKEIMIFDTSKEARILGTKYRDMFEVAKDSLAVISKRGW